MKMSSSLMKAASLVATATGATLLLSGCGGSSATTKTYAPDTAFGPAIYGLDASLADPGLSYPTDYLETSGLGSPSGSSAYFVAVEDKGYSGTPPNPTYLFQKNSDGSYSLPEGFASGGQYVDQSETSMDGAVLPGTSVQFRVNISNGQTSTGSILGIVPSSVVMTSTDPAWTIGTVPLTFDSNYGYTGPLANCPYGTAAFTIPFTTAGLHPVTVSVADTAGNKSSTTFEIAVVTAGSSCFLAQAVETAAPSGAGSSAVAATYTNFAAGDTIELTTTTGTVVSTQTADPSGSAIFFVPPGTYGLKDVTQKTANVVPITLAIGSSTLYNDGREGAGGFTALPAPASSSIGGRRLKI